MSDIKFKDLTIDDLKDRYFKVWDYSPSFSRLLIRSSRKDQHDYNIDIIFYGVRLIDVQSILGKIYGIEFTQDIDDYTSQYTITCEYGVFHIHSNSCIVLKYDGKSSTSYLDTI